MSKGTHKTSTGHDTLLDLPLTRRQVLVGGTLGALSLMAGSSSVFAATEADREIRVGFISPRSGNLGLFGQGDPYILQIARKALAKGLAIGGKTYRVTILDRDTQSSPSRASQLAHELINQSHVHLMLATSTPEVTNPVADACEAASVPNLATVVPWQSFYFARGAKPGQPSPFKWTFCFSFGTESFVKAYLSEWAELKTNKKVGVMYPNDADGMAVRDHLAPELEKAGYKIIDPGPYQDGTTDYSSQIALFNRENCQIFNTFPIPPDFDAFWRQAAQLHYTDKVIIAQIAKTGLFPSQVTPLGPLGYNLACGVYWSPVFPYDSPATGITPRELADGYEKSTGRQWNQQLGASMSLIDVGIAALKASSDPTSRDAIRKAITTLDATSMVGNVNFKTGPTPNVSVTPQIGAQWVKARPGSKYELDLVTVEHATDPQVPIQRKLVPYHA
ncbi:MAG: ABC transporter substrate-binding protein [Rhodanobacteraceae bacterium]